MRVILIAAITADGKIAQSEGQNSLDWTSKEDTRFFVEKTKECGVVVMGRKTFETIGKPLKDRRLIVLTRDAKEQKSVPPLAKGGLGGVEYSDESPRDLVARLEREGCSQVAIGGGASIYGVFLKEKLVTDLFLTVEPYVFGDGVSLASGLTERLKLNLVSVEKLGEQSVLLHYTLLESYKS